MKGKKLAKLARKFEQITIALEELADDVQGNICALDGSPLRSIREAVRHLDNAVFYLDEHACRKMSANYQARAEAEAAMLLAKLAGDMEHAAIRLPVLLAHAEAAVHNAEELRVDAACVKQWSERLKQ